MMYLLPGCMLEKIQLVVYRRSIVLCCAIFVLLFEKKLRKEKHTHQQKCSLFIYLTRAIGEAVARYPTGGGKTRGGAMGSKWGK